MASYTIEQMRAVFFVGAIMVIVVNVVLLGIITRYLALIYERQRKMSMFMYDRLDEQHRNMLYITGAVARIEKIEADIETNIEILMNRDAMLQKIAKYEEAISDARDVLDVE